MAGMACEWVSEDRDGAMPDRAGTVEEGHQPSQARRARAAARCGALRLLEAGHPLGQLATELEPSPIGDLANATATATAGPPRPGCLTYADRDQGAAVLPASVHPTSAFA